MKELGSREILALLGDMHPDLSPTAVKSRYAYFQRNGFPAMEQRGGQGVRIGYDLVTIWQLILAFELLRNSVSPATASKIIETNWARLSAIIGKAFLEIAAVKFGVSAKETKALIKSGPRRARGNDPESDDRVTFVTSNEGTLPGGFRSGILIDLSNLVRMLDSVAPQMGMATSDFIQLTMTKWASTID